MNLHPTKEEFAKELAYVKGYWAGDRDGRRIEREEMLKKIEVATGELARLADEVRGRLEEVGGESGEPEVVLRSEERKRLAREIVEAADLTIVYEDDGSETVAFVVPSASLRRICGTEEEASE